MYRCLITSIQGYLFLIGFKLCVRGEIGGKKFCLLASLQKVKFWPSIHPRFDPLAYFQETGTFVNISSVPESASIVSRDCSSPWIFSIGTGTSRPAQSGLDDIFLQF